MDPKWKKAERKRLEALRKKLAKKDAYAFPMLRQEAPCDPPSASES